MADAAPLFLSPLPSPPRRRRRKPLPLPCHSPGPPLRRHLYRRRSPETLLSEVNPAAAAAGDYWRIAAGLASAGRLRDLLLLVESSAGSGAEYVLNPALASTAVDAAIDNGDDVGAVVDFVRRADKVGMRVAAVLSDLATGAIADECHRLGAERRFTELVKLVEALAGSGIPVKSIVDPIPVLNQITEMGDIDMAIRFACSFPQCQLLLSIIMEEFGKRKDLSSALRAFEALKSYSGGINMFACRSIIDICGACGDFILARKIFEELLEQKIIPNVFVFNSLMSVNAHDLNYTFEIYRHMQDLGVQPDLASYNILLKACCNAKRVDLAQSIYEEMNHKASKELLRLDVFTYSTMMKVFADAKMWNMASKIKDDMCSAGVRPNLVTWSSLINACAHGCSIDQAIRVLEEMIMDGCEPNAQCFNIILNACIQNLEYDKAFRLFYRWKEFGMKISSTSGTNKNIGGNATSNVQVDGQSNESSSSLVIPFEPTVASYNIMLKACGSDVRRAKDLLAEMERSNLKPNHISWSVLINICGKARDVKGAMQAFRIMKRSGIKRDVAAYTSIIKACVDNKSMNMAFSLYEEMKRRGLKPNMATYNILLMARRKYGSLHEVQKCLGIYQDMRKAGYRSNDYYLKELIEEWCEGVLCADSENRFREPDRAEKGCMARRPHNFLLEKVAVHLQADVNNKRLIDVRGLTKIEARIVILSFLRMIRENYLLSKLAPALSVAVPPNSRSPELNLDTSDSVRVIEKDVVIVIGPAAGYIVSDATEPEIEAAVVAVLQDELQLEVIRGHAGASSAQSTAAENGTVESGGFAGLRRPENLTVVKVSARSLNLWLEKKVKRRDMYA